MSPTLSFTAGSLPSPPPQAPTLIQSASGQIDFEWLPTADIGGASYLSNYIIYKDGTTVIHTATATTLSYSYTPPTPGISYKITIASKTVLGEGA